MPGCWTLFKRKEGLEDRVLCERETDKYKWVCTFFTLLSVIWCLICSWKVCTITDLDLIILLLPSPTSETSSSRCSGSLGHRSKAPTSLDTHSLSPPPTSYKSSSGSAAHNTPNSTHFSIAYPQPSPLPKPNGKESLNMFSYWRWIGKQSCKVPM